MNWRVFNVRGLEVATFRYAEDAAAFVAILGDGASVCYGRTYTNGPGTLRRCASTVVWTEGAEDQSASESYDDAAEIMRRRAR